MTRSIPLPHGKSTIVSDCDYDRLSRFNWSYGKNGYVYCHSGYMHRMILDAQKGTEVDHIDSNRLNNQRENLRLCTVSQNRQNTGKKPFNTSGYKGVTFHKDSKKWIAQIDANGKHIHIGCYNSKEEAAKAYDKAAMQYHGEFAKLNF